MAHLMCYEKFKWQMYYEKSYMAHFIYYVKYKWHNVL